MNNPFEKQVYVRLSEDGTSFFYTVKYGPFATAPREMRLAAEGLHGAIPSLPVAARVAGRRLEEK